MDFKAGQTVTVTYQDGTGLTGVLVSSTPPALDIVVGGGAGLLFVGADGTLRPRWASAAIEVQDPPVAAPTWVAAVVVAGHVDTARLPWVRTGSGRWRNVWRPTLAADWDELINPEVVFEGIDPNG